MPDAQDPGPGGLRLIGDDGDFFAEDLIQKGGFANIRPPDKGDEPGAMRPGFAHR